MLPAARLEFPSDPWPSRLSSVFGATLGCVRLVYARYARDRLLKRYDRAHIKNN